MASDTVEELRGMLGALEEEEHAYRQHPDLAAQQQAEQYKRQCGALSSAISTLEALERRDEARARLSPMPRWDEPIPVAALEAREAQPTEAGIELERQYVKHGIIDPPRAQPKVEGRMDDAKANAFIARLEDGRHWPDTQQAVVSDWRRARASEAALSAERDRLLALVFRCREAFARGLWTHGHDGACRQCDPDAPGASTLVCAFHALFAGVVP